jgi:tetraacyldisaccharide 4'-kinase
MRMQQYLESIWYGGRAAPWFLRALAALFGVLVALRRHLYLRGWLKSTRLPVPVIIVGNITVGGSGKTPLVIALVEALRARGWRPGVISRGYGGTAKAPMLLDDTSEPQQVGDEPCLIRRRTGAPVAIGADRVAAAQLLLAVEQVDTLITDDGLQHYRLVRDVEIVVIDGVRRFGNGRLLPAGPLREPVERLEHVPFKICNGASTPGESTMHLTGDSVRAADDSGRERKLADFAGQSVHALAGIGNPARFFAFLREHGLLVNEHPFPDHHRFLRAELDFGDGLPLMMTEKDFVKCRDLVGPDAWYVSIDVQIAEDFFDRLCASLPQIGRTHRPTPADLSRF